MQQILSDTQLRILALVHRARAGPEIARAFAKSTRKKIGSGTLYTILARLRDEQLVEERSGPDKRTKVFVITADGRDVLAQTRAFHQELADFGRVG